MAYTAISIDCFIAAYSGALAGWQAGNQPSSTVVGNYSRIANAALAYAEEFDTIFATVLPNELQLLEIENLSAELMESHYPSNSTTALIPATYAKLVNAIIAEMSETDAVIAANVTNPIPVPTPVSQTVLNLATVVGVTDSLMATIPTTAIAAIVDGYYAAEDGGSIPGGYFWDPTSTETHNGGTVLNPTGHVGPGRWIGIISDIIYAKWFGVKADGRKITDGQLTLGSNVLLTASAVAEDLGKIILVRTPQNPITGTISVFAGSPPYQCLGSGTAFNTDIPNDSGAPDNGGAVFISDVGWNSIINVSSDTVALFNFPFAGTSGGHTMYVESQILTTVVAVNPGVSLTLGVPGGDILVSETGVLATISSDDAPAADAANLAAFALSKPIEYPAGIIGLDLAIGFYYADITTPIDIRGVKDATVFTRMRLSSENPPGPGMTTIYRFGMFSFQDCSGGITVSDVSFDGNIAVMGEQLTPAGCGTQKAISVFDCPNTTLRRIGSSGFGTRDEFIYANPAIVAGNQDNLRIEDCDILTNSVGLNPAPQGSGIHISGNHVVFGQVGLELQALTAIVEGNTFEMFSEDGYATGATPAVINPIAGCVISINDNIFNGGNQSTAGNPVMSIQGLTVTGYTLVLQNNQYTDIDGFFYSSPQAGIIRLDDCGGTIIIANETFDRCTAGAAGGTFIGVNGATTGKVLVDSCKFYFDTNMTIGIGVNANVPAGAVKIVPGCLFDDGIVTQLLIGSNEYTVQQSSPTLGVNLTDADATINIGQGSRRVLPAATLSSNRTVTLGTTGSPVTNEILRIERFDATANTLAIVNGGPGAGTLYTFPVSVTRAADFQWNGTDWIMAGTVAITPET